MNLFHQQKYAPAKNYVYQVVNKRKIKKILIYWYSCSKNCSRKTSSFGKEIYCLDNEVVNEYCGSRGGRECLDEKVNMVKCCKYIDDTSSPSQFLYSSGLGCEWKYNDTTSPSQFLYSSDLGCKWKYSNRYGESANCDHGYVMTGSCGSASGRECPDRNAHGARCCKLYNLTGKNICFD